jgi:hypothetical protein
LGQGFGLRQQASDNISTSWGRVAPLPPRFLGGSRLLCETVTRWESRPNWCSVLARWLSFVATRIVVALPLQWCWCCSRGARDTGSAGRRCRLRWPCRTVLGASVDVVVLCGGAAV